MLGEKMSETLVGEVAAAPRRRPGPRRRARLDRRPACAARTITDTGSAGHRAGRRGDARPRVQPARRADRRPRPGRRRRSGGRSTARRPRSTTSVPKTEIFETGIKVIDLLCPLRARRQDRPLRRRRRRQDGHHPGAHRPPRPLPRRLLRVRRRRRAHPRGQRPLARDAGGQDRRHRQVASSTRPSWSSAR